MSTDAERPRTPTCAQTSVRDHHLPVVTPQPGHDMRADEPGTTGHENPLRHPGATSPPCGSPLRCSPPSPPLHPTVELAADDRHGSSRGSCAAAPARSLRGGPGAGTGGGLTRPRCLRVHGPVAGSMSPPPCSRLRQFTDNRSRRVQVADGTPRSGTPGSWTQPTGQRTEQPTGVCGGRQRHHETRHGRRHGR